jgi:hypothetical protein
MFYDRWILTQVAGPDSESEPLGLAMAVQVIVAVAGGGWLFWWQWIGDFWSAELHLRVRICA